MNPGRLSFDDFCKMRDKLSMHPEFYRELRIQQVAMYFSNEHRDVGLAIKSIFKIKQLAAMMLREGIVPDMIEAEEIVKHFCKPYGPRDGEGIMEDVFKILAQHVMKKTERMGGAWEEREYKDIIDSIYT